MQPARGRLTPLHRRSDPYGLIVDVTVPFGTETHETLVSSHYDVTVQVRWSVDVAQVGGAVVGIEDERTAVKSEKVFGLRVVVVEEHVFGVGELHRDGVVVGVAGLQVAGDEDELLLPTRAGVDKETRHTHAVVALGILLYDLVV